MRHNTRFCNAVNNTQFTERKQRADANEYIHMVNKDATKPRLFKERDCLISEINWGESF
jgi:hypothetical protein